MVTKVKKRFLKALPMVVVAIVLIVGFLIFRGKSGVPKVTVTKAELRSISKTISASGQTGVSEGYTSRALVSGSIKKVNYKSGDAVKIEDVIMEFDQTSLKASLDTAYSSYLGSKADLSSYDQRITAAKATEDIRKRERDEAWRSYMADNGETKKQAYKNAEALYQTAVASVTTLENDKKTIQNTVSSSYSSYYATYTNYQNGTVKAPADGNLALANISQGSYVAVGQELFSITSPTNLVFKTEIDEADISYVKVGMKAKVSLDSYPGEYFDGKIQSIDAKVISLANGSTAIMADISFDTGKVAPIVGLAGSADVEIEKSDEVLSVAQGTILEESDKKYVYVVTNNLVYKKEVETGFEGDDYVGIVSGLNEADLVVMDPGSYSLKDGIKVSL